MSSLISGRALRLSSTSRWCALRPSRAFHSFSGGFADLATPQSFKTAVNHVLLCSLGFAIRKMGAVLSLSQLVMIRLLEGPCTPAERDAYASTSRPAGCIEV